LSFDLDMTAVARVAKRVRLLEIRLVDLVMRRTADLEGGSSLSGDVKRNCKPLKWDAGVVEVSCNFHFGATEADSQVAYIDATYLLRYGVEGEEPIADIDAKHFAFANGAYNSWPFARELFHSFSSRMGLPPFVLPVLTFTPTNAGAKAAPALPPAAPGVAQLPEIKV